MEASRGKRFLSALLSVALTFSLGTPSLAYAAEKVQVENHTTSSEAQSSVSGITIDKVDAPQAGQALDGMATVTTTEGKEWDVPVLWVRDDQQLATEAEEGRTYLPAIAFVVPREYQVEGTDAYTVELSDELAMLFGGHEIVAVYNSATGITYILPATLRGFFTPAAQDSLAAQNQGATAPAPVSEPAPAVTAAPRSLVDIYCSKSARDAFTDEDLEWLLNLVLHTLEPQAVELLLSKFPSLGAGAANGAIGREIGMYVYYLTGDQDGIPEHTGVPAEALAYVTGDPITVDGEVKYAYMIGIDLSSLVQKDKDGNPVRNSEGKLVIARSGEPMITFNNTIVHELFHALMDDYNRTGMAGSTTLTDIPTDAHGNFLTEEASKVYNRVHFPTWFIEGSASSVENIFTFRYLLFDGLRRSVTDRTTYNEWYDTQTFMYNYLAGVDNDGNPAYYDLGFCTGYDNYGNKISNTASAYVSGYLATLYLSNLATKRDPALGPAITYKDDKIDKISADNLRMGLDAILKRLHDGETLDQVIYDISPTDSKGDKIYKNTDDFTAKFISGEEDPNNKGQYLGEFDSQAFVVDFLNYLLWLQKNLPEGERTNGSILFDFDMRYDVPLDENKPTNSEYLVIVDSNENIVSTVPNSIALAGGGKSETGTPVIKAGSDGTEGVADEAEPMSFVPAEGEETVAAAAKDALAAVVSDEATDEAVDEVAADDEATTESAPEAAAVAETTGESEAAVAPEAEVTAEPVADAAVVAEPVVEVVAEEAVAEEVPLDEAA